jgi:hypothetical protein
MRTARHGSSARRSSARRSKVFGCAQGETSRTDSAGEDVWCGRGRAGVVGSAVENERLGHGARHRDARGATGARAVGRDRTTVKERALKGHGRGTGTGQYAGTREGNGAQEGQAAHSGLEGAQQGSGEYASCMCPFMRADCATVVCAGRVCPLVRSCAHAGVGVLGVLARRRTRPCVRAVCCAHVRA